MTETKNALTVPAIRSALDAQPARSAWSRGVKEYAEDLLNTLSGHVECGYIDPADLADRDFLRRALLNGADDWGQFSYGGCSLIYDPEIAERLCNPTELKRTDHGQRRPNCREEWLDVQARALFQAAIRIGRAVDTVLGFGPKIKL